MKLKLVVIKDNRDSATPWSWAVLPPESIVRTEGLLDWRSDGVKAAASVRSHAEAIAVGCAALEHAVHAGRP
jgi:hypothetical protein